MIEIGIPTYSGNDEDGYVGVQVDQHGDGSSDPTCPAGEVHTPYGFYCRPLDPVVGPDGSIDPAQSGKAIFFWLNQDLHVIPAQDTRIVPKLPPLGKGESLMYGQEGQFIRCRNGGEIAMMTTDDGTTDGQSIYMSMKPTGFTRTSPWGTERFDSTGWHVNTTTGASLDIGGIGGIPGFSAFGSYVNMQAAMARINSMAVSLGSNPIQDNVALSTATLAAFTAATTVIDAVGVVLASLIPASGVTAPQLVTFASALTAFNTAMGLAAPLIRSPQVTASAAI